MRTIHLFRSSADGQRPIELRQPGTVNDHAVVTSPTPSAPADPSDADGVLHFEWIGRYHHVEQRSKETFQSGFFARSSI